MAKKAKPAPAEPAETAAEQPYYLQRAHIKDFRSIRDAAVEFKPGLNIIIGANGSGKTNFVRCVESGLPLTSHEFIGGNGSSFIIDGTSRTEITYEKNDHSLLDELSDDLQDDFTPQNVIAKIGENIFTGENTLDIFIKQSASNPLFFSSLLLGRTILIKHGIPSPYSFANTGMELAVNDRGHVSISNYKNTPPSGLKEVRRVLSNILTEAAREHKLEINDIASLVEKAIEVWINIIKINLKRYSTISEIKNNTPIQVYRNSTQNKYIVKGIEASFKVSNDWLPFDALSSGTQRMFYIISEIASPASSEFRSIFLDLSRTYFTNKIILLEEPELGIHPHQLHLLLNFLREQSDKHQLIITTHSPQVLDMLREDKLDRITICELHKTKGTQFRKLKKTQQDDARRYMREVGFLSDYWRLGDLEAAK